MTKLSVVVKNDKETKTIKVEGISEKEVIGLIKEVIGLRPETVVSPASFARTITEPTSSSVVSTPRKGVTVTVNNKSDDGGVSALAVEEARRNRSRQLPLVGSENRSSFSVGDNIKVTLQNTRLTEDDVRIFRSYCKCPLCGTEHTGRYVNAEQKYIKCFECKSKMQVEPASTETQIFEGKEIPKLSIDGYYFVAKTLYEEPELV